MRDAELTSQVTGNVDSLIEDTFIIGSPQECIEQLARYSELGFTQVCLRLFYPGMSQGEVLEHIELTGREVLPEVHRV